MIGRETRCVLLGHLQRGGAPTSADRLLATRFGVHAVDLLFAREWGTMVALTPPDVTATALEESSTDSGPCRRLRPPPSCASRRHRVRLIRSAQDFAHVDISSAAAPPPAVPSVSSGAFIDVAGEVCDQGGEETATGVL